MKLTKPKTKNPKTTTTSNPTASPGLPDVAAVAASWPISARSAP